MNRQRELDDREGNDEQGRVEWIFCWLRFAYLQWNGTSVMEAWNKQKETTK